MNTLTLQKAINIIFGAILYSNKTHELLKEDGITGMKTMTAIVGGKRQVWTRKGLENIESVGAVALLKKTFKKLGYKWDKRFNFIGIRVDDEYTDGFTDFALIYKDGLLRAFPFSTKPSLWGVRVRKNVQVDGLAGVAVLAEGQYIDTYNLQGAWWSGRKFWWQRKPVSCLRDKSGGKSIDRKSVIKSDEGFFKRTGNYYAINIHTWRGWRAKTLSWWHWTNGVQGGGLSIGCQVGDDSIWEELLKEVKAGDSDNWLTYTLLHKNEIVYC